MKDTEKTCISISLSKVLLAKVRGFLDVRPSYTIHTFIEEIVRKSLNEYEDEHGDIDPVRDLYFNIARKTKRDK